MSLEVRLEEELGDEFGCVFDEFDEFGGHSLVCVREKAVRLVSLGVRLVSLGVRLEQEARDDLEVILMSLVSCEERGWVG